MRIALYQLEHNKQTYNSHSFIPDNIKDEKKYLKVYYDELKKYALRKIEVDANAYSELFLQQTNPLLEQRFPDWLRVEVEKRKKELLKELNFDGIKNLFD